MITNTFCHIPGVGVKTEENLWRAGVLDWSAVADAEAGDGFPLSNGRLNSMKVRLEESLERHAAGDAAYFSKLLPAAQQWRMLPDYLDSIAYVDIETTGTLPQSDYITAVAVYDGREVRSYIHSRNMDDLMDDLREFKLIVTFNGKCFDIPLIERRFDTKIHAAHLDLRFVLSAAGIKGGLKKCEIECGLDRGGLRGVDGYWAVLLWQEYVLTKDERFLETLLAYNAEDVINLEPLAATAFNLHLKNTPFFEDLQMEIRHAGFNPYKADAQVLEHIRRRMHGAL